MWYGQAEGRARARYIWKSGRAKARNKGKIIHVQVPMNLLLPCSTNGREGDR